MNPLLRIGPYLYAAAHSYNALWELAGSPRARRIAERDAARLRQRFPFLGSYAKVSAAVAQRLTPAHADYTARVSPDPIALALPLAIFLGVLCEQLRPRRILDLGSGFSSYVFRAVAAVPAGTPPAGAAPVIYSIDQSRAWLDKTRAFLQHHGADAPHLATWDEFAATTPAPFDMVLQDFATLDTRRRMLDRVVDLCGPGGLIVIDDMHVPGYRRATLRALDRRGLDYFSLRLFTRKRLRYAYLVAP
jgi:predicted O-methyltransferase YrrM